MFMPAGRPDAVVVLADHVAMRVRLRSAIEPFSPVEFAASEAELISRMRRPARLVTIHGVAAYADVRLPARVRNEQALAVTPIVVLASSKDPVWRDREKLIDSGLVEDIIHTDTEHLDPLIAAWSLHRDRCRPKVEALRLAHQTTPEPLHAFLEELLLGDSAKLSVAAWAATKSDGSRFALRRELAKEGVTPSMLIDVARVLNIVARVLMRAADHQGEPAGTAPEAGSSRRLLARTLRMSPRDVTHLAREEGADAVRDRARLAVRELLRGSVQARRARR